MTSEILSLFIDHLAFGVRLLKLINDDEKVEAVKHIKIILADFTTNKDTELHVEIVDVKPDILELDEDIITEKENSDLEPNIPNENNIEIAGSILTNTANEILEYPEQFQVKQGEGNIAVDENSMSRMSTSLAYSCTFCPKRFPRGSLLQIHKRIHTGEKPFECKVCGQCFGSQSSLIKHTENMHTPEEQMPYKCNVCGKTFSKARRKVYFGHIKQHSGIKDHTCPLCNAPFSSRGYLGNHFTKVHKKKLFDVENEIQLKMEVGTGSKEATAVPQPGYSQEYQFANLLDFDFSPA